MLPKILHLKKNGEIMSKIILENDLIEKHEKSTPNSSSHEIDCKIEVDNDKSQIV